MDLTVLHLAVPTLSAELQPTSAQLLWIVDIYGFMVAGFLITMGTLGDRIGRRQAADDRRGGVRGGLGPGRVLDDRRDADRVSRALLGIAGATLAPSTLSLIFNMFHDPRPANRARSRVWISAFSAGGAIGPVVGGILLEHFWWGSVFLIALPVMALLLVARRRVVLPGVQGPDAGRLDLASAALSLVAILTVIFGLKQIAQDGLAIDVDRSSSSSESSVGSRSSVDSVDSTIR